jgi:hypothetical protein
MMARGSQDSMTVASSIHFRAPKLSRMANGLDCIELTENGTWESFPTFAAALIKQIGGKLVEKIDGPDVRIWTIQLAGCDVSLVYRDYPNGISLEPGDGASSSQIAQLFARFSADQSPDGL